MNQTLATPRPDNIMANGTNNPTPRNNVWKYEAKISALKSYVQCELSTLRNEIDRFMKTFNKAISNFETKPQEIVQDNIEFLQNELRSKEKYIQTLIETQTAVLENLPLSQPPQQAENNASYHDSPLKDVNQLNKKIIFKQNANQEYNNQSQHHVQILNIKKQVSNRTVTIIKNINQKKRLYIGILNTDVKEQYLIELFGFNATTCLRGICCVDLTTVKNQKNKGFGFAVMPEHVQKEY